VFTVNYSDSGRFLDYQAVPPLEGPDGTRRTARYNYSLHQQLVVTEKFDYPEVMVRWADWFYTLDGSISGHRGREGVAWRRAEEGELSYTGEQGYYQMIEATQYGQMQNVNWQHTGLGHNSVFVRESMVSAQEDPTIGQEYRLWKWTGELYEPYQIPPEDTLPDLFFTAEQAREIADLRTTIQDFVTSSVARFVTGAQDIDNDAEWQAYVRELEQMGVERYVEIYQTAYDINKGHM
jgi:putative aldouronate transport system substrate-binding protein